MKVRSPMRRLCSRATALLLLVGGLVAIGPAPAGAAPTDAAYNAGTGALNVDYASYLSKHDIVYNRPNTNPLHGLTVGNGKTGAMVWNQNGLTAQVSGVDLAQQSTYAAGNLNLFSSPQIDSGYSTFQQRLSLYDGTLTTKYDSNRTVTVFGAPNSEVMGIHVEDSRPGVSSIGLDLSLWDMNTVQNIADVPNLTTWRTVSTFADSTGVGLSRGQADPQNFGYTFAATVEGANYTAQTVNGTRVRLNITPTSSYTIWFTAASRINSPGQNSVQQAKNQLAAAKSTGYTSTLNAYKNWWHAFWAKSFVQYGGSADNDYLENAYYLFTYMIAAGGYGNYPLHFINGELPGDAGQLQVEQRLLVLEPTRRLQLVLQLQPSGADAHVQQPLRAQPPRVEELHADAVRHGLALGARDDGLGRQRPRHHQQRLRQRPLLHRHRGRVQHVPVLPVHQRHDLPARRRVPVHA